MVITMMIEDVKGRGGSNIPAEKVKHVSKIICNKRLAL